MKIWLGIIVVALTGCAMGPRAPSAANGPPAVRAPSVYALLGERERLELTSGQVEALDSIGRWLAGETARLRQELEPSQRPGRPEPDSAEVATLADAITAANVQAIQGVEALLSSAQRETVCEIQREDREQDSSARAARSARPSPFGGAASRARWTWCPEEQASPPGV